MAERHSIDHPPGSQDLSSAFYAYHRQFGGIWYIKNEHGQFIDGSVQFSSTFLMCEKILEPYGAIDDHSVFGFFNEKIKEVENQVNSEKQKRAILASVFVQGKQEPYIFTVTPFLNGVYVRMDSLYFLGIERKIASALCNRKDGVIYGHVQQERFFNINPFIDLNPDEWLIAWLMCVGLSQREIAVHLSITTRTVEKKVADIYTQLILLDYDTFMAMSTIHQWPRFIPPLISTQPILFELKLM